MRRPGGANGASAWGITLLRLIVGAVLVMHGYLALTLLGPQTVAGYITRMGYPSSLATVLAWYLIVVHLAGGGLIIIGLWTRWAALANIPPLASAVFLLHLGQGFFMKAIEITPGRYVVGGYEFSLTVLVATIALIILGCRPPSTARGDDDGAPKGPPSSNARSVPALPGRWAIPASQSLVPSRACRRSIGSTARSCTTSGTTARPAADHRPRRHGGVRHPRCVRRLLHAALDGGGRGGPRAFPRPSPDRPRARARRASGRRPRGGDRGDGARRALRLDGHPPGTRPPPRERFRQGLRPDLGPQRRPVRAGWAAASPSPSSRSRASWEPRWTSRAGTAPCRPARTAATWT